MPHQSKETLQEGLHARKQPFNGKCNSCGKIGHMAHNYKVKDVREGEIENKDVDNYLLSKREEERRKGEKGVITRETSERSLNGHLPVAFNHLLNPSTQERRKGEKGVTVRFTNESPLNGRSLTVFNRLHSAQVDIKSTTNKPVEPLGLTEQPMERLVELPDP
jgi:hypothetical protein